MKKKNSIIPTTFDELRKITSVNRDDTMSKKAHTSNNGIGAIVKGILTLLVLVTLVLISVFISRKHTSTIVQGESNLNWWNIQSIDTVKYSRDVAREKLDDPSFDKTIDNQVRLIASTGANYITVDTPYDEEFLPFLKRWITTARKYGLKIWFRGNMSGWEGWFGYKKIDRSQHILAIKNFILSNGDLFENGDIFTACPECENGGPGDPRQTRDVVGFRQFLIDEYEVTNDAFRKIGKNVRSNFTPMNGDVARLIMDKSTTRNLGGVVVIDHYVATPEKLTQDVHDLADTSGGKVMLGEFGVPIPDINGNMTEKQQADWLEKALKLLAQDDNLVGMNYWVSFGGSTQLWNSNGTPRLAVKVIKSYYEPEILTGEVVNEINQPVVGASMIIGDREVLSNSDGTFRIPYISANKQPLKVVAVSFKDRQVDDYHAGENLKVVMVKQNENILFKVEKDLYKLTH